MTRNKNEVEFCKKTLKPILEAMRPYIVNLRYTHGNTEFGKDFTFSYINPLNHRVNVGLQAKYGDIKGSSKSLTRDIIGQIKVAFEVPYKNIPSRQELYLNELYIVCSGKYRNNAIEIIERALEKNYNVRFLDGSDVQDLKKKVSSRKGMKKLETKIALNALLVELDQNIQIAKEIDRKMDDFIKEKKHFLTNYRLNCLERVLELDIDDKWVVDEAVVEWNNLAIENNLLNEIRYTGSEKTKRDLWNNAKKDIENLADFRKYIASYLERLE